MRCSVPPSARETARVAGTPCRAGGWGRSPAHRRMQYARRGAGQARRPAAAGSISRSRKDRRSPGSHHPTKRTRPTQPHEPPLPPPRQNDAGRFPGLVSPRYAVRPFGLVLGARMLYSKPIVNGALEYIVSCVCSRTEHVSNMSLSAYHRLKFRRLCRRSPEPC